MQKPFISNRFLNKKWNDKENDIYFKKIWLAKPSSTIQVSVKSKSQAPKMRSRPNENFFTIKQFEIERDNKTLLNKINNISTKTDLSIIIMFIKKNSSRKQLIFSSQKARIGKWKFSKLLKKTK